jgi:thioredoxin reductase
VTQEITVIIGAGPYGLAAAAYLKANNIPTLLFGKPMEFWKKMPPHMYLKSTWSSLNIVDPKHAYTLDKYARAHQIAKQDPVSLKSFLAYSQWFIEKTVLDIDQTYVKLLAQDGKGFHVELEDGRSVEASRVLVASGVSLFPCIPDFATNLPPTLVTHSQDHTDFQDFQGKKVIVVGRGQSAFESAALLVDAGAEVELVARGPIVWINRRLYRYTGIAKRIFYPPSDIGPAGISWLVAFPQLFGRFSDKTRVSIDTRSVRPSVAPWLRSRVEGRFTITPETSIVEGNEQDGGLSLKLSNGSTRQVDHVVLGTGYAPSVEALGYIDPALRQQVQTHNGYPILNQWFESSVPHLYFSGALAAYNFGPICRFVTGSGAPARQLARHTALGL